MVHSLIKSISAILIFCSCAYSQNGFSVYSYSPAASVTSATNVAVDAAGNYWLAYSCSSGSYNDVLKFDGSTWATYQSPNSAITSNKNYCLEIDASGNVWIGSSNGLQKFDGSNWITFNTTNSSIAGNRITALSFEGSNVWIGTFSGLSKFDGSTFTNFNKANSAMNSDTVWSVYAENANDIWIGNNLSLTHFDAAGTFVHYNFTSAPSNSIYVSSITEMANSVWISTTGKGILRFNGNGFDNFDNLVGPGANVNGTMNISKLSLMQPDHFLYWYANGLHNFHEQNLNSFYHTGILMNTTYARVGYNDVFMKPFVFAAGFNMIKLLLLNDSLYNGLGLGPYGINENNFKYLDINQVRAGVSNRGDKHWNYTSHSYEVPKGSGTNTSMASGLWMGGLDNQNQLHMAVQMYRQSEGDFWPGPLDTINVIADSATAWEFDRVWKVNQDMIYFFQQAFAAGNVQNGSYTVPEDILTWPAHGNGNYSRKLAPFIDVNANGIYDPLVGGDYPKIKGDESVYTIYNDNLANHDASFGGLPLGIEVHFEDYSFNCPIVADSLKALNYTTFQDYAIINRSQNQYDSVYFGFWEQSELGNNYDDKTTAIVAENYLLTYNDDEFDQDAFGVSGYGANPPLQSFVFLDGPVAPYADTLDNDNNGQYNESGEKCLLTNFMSMVDLSFCSNLDGFYEDADYYGYLHSYFRDSTHLKVVYDACIGGNNKNFWARDFPYQVTQPHWVSSGYNMVGSGPFRMMPGDTIHYVTAYVFTRDTTLPYYDSTGFYPDLFLKNKSDIEKVKQWYANNSYPSCHNLFLGGKEETRNYEMKVFPNPAAHNINITFQNAFSGKLEIFDVSGKEVMKTTLSNITNTVNLSMLERGFFVLKATDRSGTTYISKIIIER